ncbi:MAG: SH3 domain-containing protein [Sphingomonadales bacterium]|nr:MAG: SH3 domain-containing protein [Sphingomonadales bacterium]
MPGASDIAWFKASFAPAINQAVKGTPFDLDMLTAVACQETGYIWQVLRKKNLTIARILELCVGDTIDARSVFPKSKADLIAANDGQKMFDIARAALVDMAKNVPGYDAMVAKPDKFCHGYGLFQYDIQYFRVDPSYFLERRYIQLDQTLAKCVGELKQSLKTLKWTAKPTLTDMEKAAVAICYNTGKYDPARGLKQGHKDSAGKYYGELFYDFMLLARSVATPAPPAVTTGYKVKTAAGGKLNVRSGPAADQPNITGELADGLAVTALAEAQNNGFLNIAAEAGGIRIIGWASAKYLQKA